MKDEMKDKYSVFIAEISEIMGLGKPIDILKLCATTDSFFRPLKKRIEELEKENAELTKDRDYYSDAIDKQVEATLKLHKEHEKLNEELKKWKDEWQEQVQKAIDEGYARTQQTIQLTKAKEIIKKFSEFANNKIEYDPENPQKHTDLWNKLCEQAEQFLKENADGL